MSGKADEGHFLIRLESTEISDQAPPERITCVLRRRNRVKDWTIAVAILVTLAASLALGEDFKTINGKEYRDAIISRVEPDGIVLKTHSAIVKLYFSELSEEVRKRFDQGGVKTRAATIPRRTSVSKTKPPKLAAAVEKLQKQGFLRVDCSEPEAKAWIASKVWKGWDAAEKEKVTKNLAAYCHPENPSIGIFDKQSARKLASYGPFERFEVY
jgi:hypothetical protein